MTAIDADEAVDAAVARCADELIDLSHAVHGFAETAFSENRSAAAVIDRLKEGGFAVQDVPDLPTAFVAVFGSGSFNVGICAEYDALPEIGHGCGHNVVAASAVGAALALIAVADQLDLTITVLGTPAEERGGGKVLMLQAGLFDSLTCAMMIHPGPVDADPRYFSTQAFARFSVTYRGRASHAAAAPQMGVNAADASVVAQVAIGLLRQQLPSSARVAVIVTNGGQATNIIPEEVKLEVEVREYEMTAQQDLYERVTACFEAGALASGCSHEILPIQPPYEPLAQDPRLAEAYVKSARHLGRSPVDTSGLAGGSTDMGNVSQYLPAIHPLIAISGASHGLHSIGFAGDAVSPEADQTVLDGAKLMARTVVAITSDSIVRGGLLAAQAGRLPYGLARTKLDAPDKYEAAYHRP